MRTSSTTAQMGRLNLESLNKLPHLRLGNGFGRHFMTSGKVLSLGWMG